MGVSEVILRNTNWPGLLLGVTSLSFLCWSKVVLEKELQASAGQPLLEHRQGLSESWLHCFAQSTHTQAS